MENMAESHRTLKRSARKQSALNTLQLKYAKAVIVNSSGRKTGHVFPHVIAYSQNS